MTAPLNSDGSNWPAKGYATSETVSALSPVATLVAGEDFTVSFSDERGRDVEGRSEGERWEGVRR